MSVSHNNLCLAGSGSDGELGDSDAVDGSSCPEEDRIAAVEFGAVVAVGCSRLVGLCWVDRNCIRLDAEEASLPL